MNIFHAFMHMCKCISLDQESRSRIIGSRSKHVLHFHKYCQIALHKVHSNLYSHQQCVRVRSLSYFNIFSLFPLPNSSDFCFTVMHHGFGWDACVCVCVCVCVYVWWLNGTGREDFKQSSFSCLSLFIRNCFSSSFLKITILSTVLRYKIFCYGGDHYVLNSIHPHILYLLKSIMEIFTWSVWLAYVEWHVFLFHVRRSNL